MVEYSVNVANKFGEMLSDDEVGDPEDLLAKVTNVESAREQRSASQKKADKKVASKVKKSAAAAAAAAAKEMADNAKKAVVTEPTVKRESNKENRPHETSTDSPRGGGRGGGYRGGMRGMRGGGRGGGRGGIDGHTANLPPRLQQFDKTESGGDIIQTDDGVGGGQHTYRGGRGRGSYRGGGGGYGRGGGSFRGGNNSLPHRNRDGSGSEMTGGTATIQQQVVDVSGDPNAIGTFGDEAGEKDFTVPRDHRGAPPHQRGGFGAPRRERGGGGGFGFRAGRGGRGRQFERMSGSDKTTVKPFVKKAGFGRGNWGTEKDELAGETESSTPLNTTNEDAQLPTANKEKPDEKAASITDEVSTKVDDTPKEMTLDEYEKLKAKRESPKFNIRQAGEGENKDAYATLVPIVKESVDSDDSYDLTHTAKAPREQRLDIEIKFTDESGHLGFVNNTGGRSSRGAGGGGAFRGGRGSDHHHRGGGSGISDRGGGERGGSGRGGYGGGGFRGTGGGMRGGRGERRGGNNNDDGTTTTMSTSVGVSHSSAAPFAMSTDSFPELSAP